MTAITNSTRMVLAACTMLLVSACAPSKYVVSDPAPSNMGYEANGETRGSALALVDARREDDRIFNTGTLTATLEHNDAPLDAPAFLAANLQAEMASRGLPVTVKVGEAGEDSLRMNVFRMQNHRANGFAPYVTFTYASIDLEDAEGMHRVSSFVKRGKVPVWSFDEVIEPTMNQPLSVVVKELASKIANRLYGYQAPDAEVDRLIGKVNGKRGDNVYIDVYALGFTNNSKAIPVLVELTKDSDEYVRLAAISSLGNMRAVDQFDYLRSIYESNDGLWQDRAMALKAIGDFGTGKSRAYLESELAKWQTQDPPTKESAWTSQLIHLYL